MRQPAHSVKRMWITLKGVQVHTRIAGNVQGVTRPGMILVHGLGVSSRYLVPTAKLLADHYCVYIPDFPGFGRSGKPAQVLSLAELADVIAALMDAVKLERAVLLGNSFGCQIIAEFAMRHGERLSQAILVGPTMDRQARTSPQQIWRLLRDAFYEHPALPFIVLRDFWDAGPQRVWRTLQHALADAIEQKLPHMHVPTLVVRGVNDPFAPQPWVEEVTLRLPRSWLIVVGGVGHAINYTAPDKLARATHAFLCHSSANP